MDKSSIVLAIVKAACALWKSFPLVLATILLISVVSSLLPQSFYLNLFSKNVFLDSLIGSLIGSISVGTPITSYLLGGEFLEQGISLVAVTAFLVAWVTVGVVQLPAESALLGRKFALLRNLSAFIFAIIVALITVLILGVL